MRRFSSTLLAILFVTAAYVFAWPSANIPYFGAVVLHVLSGVALLILIAAGARGILRGAALTSQIGWVLLAAGGVLGVILIYTGTRRSEWPLLYTHIGLCVAGGAFLASGWAARRDFLAGSAASGFARSVLFLIGAGLVTAGAWWLRTAPWQEAHRITNPAMAPASMDGEGDGPSGPFFPSSAQTVDGRHIPTSYFLESQSCQRCHANIYKEWQGSAHHFSSFNNAWYRKSIEYMQDTVGIKPSKWCAGCHDPALLFSGTFDRPIREVEDTPAGQAGLGCMMCHSIARVKSTMGNGDFDLEYPALHKLAASTNPFLRWTHDYLTELNPEPHRRVFLKPFMRAQTAQFCSVCHKVHLDVPVNHYRWSRGFNEYDNWQASGVSGEGARSFYYPANPQMCADCHMPATPSTDLGNIDGFIHSHRFPAANTALPFVNNDLKQLRTVEQFLEDNQLRVDVFAISPEAPNRKPGLAQGENIPASSAMTPGQQTTFAVGEESESEIPANVSRQSATPVDLLTAPLNVTGASVRRGGTYRVDVVVRTLKLGHFFPGGTVDAYDCWLELKATDDKGQTIFWSGGVAGDGKGPVDPGAHFYRSLQIDAHGNPINKRNTWSTHATVYVRLIPPGAADTVHYRIQVPPNAGDRIHVTAKLNYRKFAWWNTQFAFAGERDARQKNPAVSNQFDDTQWVFTGDTRKVPGGGKGIPNLPIVVMAQNSADLKVLPANSAEAKPDVKLRASDWTRWNDYGIGLLLQGDLTGAAGAFKKITEIDPRNPDGWVNLGRVRVQEGNLGAAEQVLERALSLAPRLARAHYFYARVLRNEGKYDQAIAHLREVLAQYPRDRVVHNDLGRILFLQRHYAEAEREFQATLSIDPEDLEANYNLMLCSTGMGEPDRAAEFQKRYLRFKADEAAQTLTGPYLRSHPDDNRERQSIHEHISEALERPAPKYAAAVRGPKGSD
ncbi:MAG: tetratricopeptide repeat protein [Candidatus Acidiferrales bacterium]